LGIFWRASSITSCSWCIWMMGICWLERLAGLILWSLSALLDIFLSFSLILGPCLSFFFGGNSGVWLILTHFLFLLLELRAVIYSCIVLAFLGHGRLDRFSCSPLFSSLSILT
jgi:hypothetical protein